MGNSAWITPTQAIELMHKKLSYYNVDALIEWSREGLIKCKSEHIEWTDDGRSYNEAKSLPEYIWSGKIKANWTTGKISSSINNEHFDEYWIITGLKFLKNDILRCIDRAKGVKPATIRADLRAVSQWAINFISERENSGAKLTKRIVEEEAKRMFPGQLGAVRTARIALDQYRAKR